jgi:hypothetical protein
MVRYQGQVATFRATIPLGAPVDRLPLAKNFVDELVFKQLKQVGMPPSEISDKSTFLRRVTLDIAGRLPTPDEVRAFEADTAPTDRDRVIDRLVASTDYADYFAGSVECNYFTRERKLNEARSLAYSVARARGFHVDGAGRYYIICCIKAGGSIATKVR